MSGWETRERRSIARSASHHLSVLPPELQRLILADIQTLAGVARSRDLPGGRAHQPDSRAAIDHLVHAWETLSGADAAQSFGNARELIAGIARQLDRVLYAFLSLHPM